MDTSKVYIKEVQNTSFIAFNINSELGLTHHQIKIYSEDILMYILDVLLNKLEKYHRISFKRGNIDEEFIISIFKDYDTSIHNIRSGRNDITLRFKKEIANNLSTILDSKVIDITLITILKEELKEKNYNVIPICLDFDMLEIIKHQKFYYPHIYQITNYES